MKIGPLFSKRAQKPEIEDRKSEIEKRVKRDEVRLAHGNLPMEFVYQRKGEPISFNPNRFSTIIYEQDEPPNLSEHKKSSKPFN